MLSWVAMERIYEREILPDPKLLKEAGPRPLRADARRLTDGELLAKLRSFGIEIDRASLERKCERALSAQEIAGPLMDQSGHGSQESDWIWICVATLWRRWFPEQPSFEELDDQMQAGYELLKSRGAVAGCRVWLEAWNDVGFGIARPPQTCRSGTVHSLCDRAGPSGRFSFVGQGGTIRLLVVCGKQINDYPVRRGRA